MKALGRLGRILALALIGCSSTTEEPLDPSGVWTMQLHFGAGDCQVTDGARRFAMIERAGEVSVELLDAQGWIISDGFVACLAGEDTCRLEAHVAGAWQENGNDVVVDEYGTYTLGETDAITGYGSVTFTITAPDGAVVGGCAQDFTANGSRE